MSINYFVSKLNRLCFVMRCAKNEFTVHLKRLYVIWKFRRGSFASCPRLVPHIGLNDSLKA